MWLLSYGTLITPVPVASPRRGEAAVSAEGQEVEEEEEQEEDEDSLMHSECIKTFAYFMSTMICPLKSRSINNRSTKTDIFHWELKAVVYSAFIFSMRHGSLMWHFCNHRKPPSAGGADVGCMGHGFYLGFPSLARQIFSHAAACRRDRRGDGGRNGSMSVRFPSGAVTTCSSDFWEEEEGKKSRESLSAALGWEREVCCYRRVGSRGLTLPTRGRFTAGDSNHLSALCHPSGLRLDASSSSCPKCLRRQNA